MNKLSDNLNRLLAEARVNASELARQTHLPAATIKNIRHGDNANPTLSTLLPIAKYFSITVSALIGEEPLIHKKQLVSVKAPLISWEINHEEIIEHTSDFSLQITENDLGIFPKDFIISVIANQAPQHRDFVIVQKLNFSRLLLREYLDESEDVYLKSLVQGCSAVKLTAEYRILGVVYECTKKFQSFGEI